MDVEGEDVDGRNKTDVERCRCGLSARRHRLQAMTPLIQSMPQRGIRALEGSSSCCGKSTVQSWTISHLFQVRESLSRIASVSRLGDQLKCREDYR